MKTIITTILLFTLTFVAKAGESFVPLQKGVRMASDDLLYEGNVLSSRDAQDLSDNKSIDLSTLEPRANDLWSPTATSLNDQESIALSDNGTLVFAGLITSNSGLLRFNANSEDGSKIYTVHLDKTLHSFLLRKNLLRKLGYTIPATKYLKKINIKFNSLESREAFLLKNIPEATDGASERWVKKVNELTLELIDVAVTEPSENDFYNVAQGVPTLTINSRSIRSLLIPYSILDLYESINKFSWIDGKIDNGAAVLPHFTGNDFSTTIEDAQWMLRKFNKLTRADIKESVDLAFFPTDVAAVLLEKIISRRNSLNRLFSVKAKMLEVDQKINFQDSVKEGKIIQKDYLGYASRFAYGDKESPFEQLSYFLYSKIQSNALDNLVAKFNSYLVKYDLGKTRSSFFKKQFEDGLNNFIKTGEIKPIGIETWSSPLLSAQLIFSRDIILGNYLGTDNLVQLADTFGASLDIGAYLGIEGLGNNLAGSVNASVSVVRTFTHVKPVKNLKQSLKEPYKNMFVNLLKNSLKERYFSLSEIQHSTQSNDEKAKKVQGLLKEIGLSLDTGESLIMTDRLMPTTEVKLNFNTGLVGAGVGVGAGVAIIKRIHIFKKSAQFLQIYDDSGFVTNVNLSFQVSEYISLLKITGKLDIGHYNFKSYTVNLSSDLDENPNFYENSLGIYNVLKNKNFEILNKTSIPVKLNASFTDRSLGFSLLFWKMKAVKGKTYYNLEAKDGINGSYFSLNKDFMNGVNAEAFSKQMVNYYLADQTKGNFSITTEGDVNPGDSFFGRSSTSSIRFEASLGADKKFERKFISISDSKQGWALSAKKLIQMMAKVNEKFEAILFDTAQIDFEKLRLFKVGYHINLYDRGIERLNTISLSEIEALENKYRTERGCEKDNSNYTSVYCGDLGFVKSDVKKCQKVKTDEDRAACNVDLVDDLLESLEFGDFKKIIGIDNLYVYGTMDGFRQHSEILNDTIFSNTVGKIGSREWSGPLDVVRELLGLSGGEFSGNWMRDSI
ncbi:MAG: hypothetical protein Q7U04_16615 [Bacteriovorax sp.]|nr:hypothetical protein [Bacteriovorax sp.]